ncbi:MAG: Mini-ribonuclease 3 [Ruminococcaceae bacterium]|nr:Mini-ribonuclease 3 [Oscillospiraceae bacterium]
MAQNINAPLVLAFVGDAVYGLYMRTRLAEAETVKMNELHHKASHLVCAEAQYRAIQHITPLLTDEELQVFKHGRNAKSGTVPKNADVIHYRHATGLEALVGHLYLEKQQERLTFLLGKVFDFLYDSEAN